MSKVIDALGRIKALCQGYVKDANDDWNPMRGDYNGGVFAGPFGTFYDRLSAYAYHEVTASGSYAFTIATVAAGELWVATGMSLLNYTGAALEFGQLQVTLGATTAALRRDVSVPHNGSLSAYTTVVASEGDEFSVYFRTLQSSGEVYGYVWGYKVKL